MAIEVVKICWNISLQAIGRVPKNPTRRTLKYLNCYSKHGLCIYQKHRISKDDGPLSSPAVVRYTVVLSNKYSICGGI